MALTRKGMNQQEAHELLRKLAIKSQTAIKQVELAIEKTKQEMV